MQANNPIQQRFNQMVEKWTQAINTPKVKIVRIKAGYDEESFIEDTFEYMLALDTQQEDLVFLIDSPWSNMDDFAKDLLEDINETIELWNTTEKPKTLPNTKVDWHPDFGLSDKNNPASLFVRNINNLSNLLVPNKDTIVSFLVKMPYADGKVGSKWMTYALEAGLESHVRIGVADSERNPIFDNISNIHSEEIYTIRPNLDLDGAIEELAEMGNPQEPETNYRSFMVKLMNAVKKRNKKAVLENAKGCLDIASTNVGKDANWLTQVVFVYTMLYNDQIAYKNYKRALFFANKAVEAGSLTIGRIDPQAAYRLLGQTLMGRGAIQRLLSKTRKACDDYKTAMQAYEKCNDQVMYVEATRSYAEMAEKVGEHEEALEAALKAFNILEDMPKETAISSTFPWLVKLMRDMKGRRNKLSDEEIDKKMTPCFGEDWLMNINKLGSAKQMKKVAMQKNENLDHGQD